MTNQQIREIEELINEIFKQLFWINYWWIIILVIVFSITTLIFYVNHYDHKKNIRSLFDNCTLLEDRIKELETEIIILTKTKQDK